MTLPKLIITGANDRYWGTDATRLYWNDLEGERYLLNVPNSGHALNDLDRVADTASAFFHSVSVGKPLPKLSGEATDTGGRITLRVRSDVKPLAARLWVARAPDLDFRPVPGGVSDEGGGRRLRG